VDQPWRREGSCARRGGRRHGGYAWSRGLRPGSSPVGWWSAAGPAWACPLRAAPGGSRSTPPGAAGDTPRLMSSLSAPVIPCSAGDAKESPESAAGISCLMAHMRGIPHEVGYLSMPDGSSLVPAVRPFGDACFGARGIAGLWTRRRPPRDQHGVVSTGQFDPPLMTRSLAQAVPRPRSSGLGPSFPHVITGPISSEPPPRHSGAACGFSRSWQLGREGRVS
jgi:hypothetical protein